MGAQKNRAIRFNDFLPARGAGKKRFPLLSLARLFFTENPHFNS
jgi:hypothetical protein